MFKNFDVSMIIPGLSCGPDTLETRALGGSESAGLYMAGALASAGARVRVFSNGIGGDVVSDEVSYSNISNWAAFAAATPHDICIAQRIPESFSEQTNARLNVLWCHDLAMGRQRRATLAALWNIDRIVVLSEFMREQYLGVLGVDPELLLVSRNGVDAKLVAEVRAEKITSNSKHLVFSGRPERGLDRLLKEIFPRLLDRDPSFRLHLAGYESGSADWALFYRECGRLAEALGDRVVHGFEACQPSLESL